MGKGGDRGATLSQCSKGIVDADRRTDGHMVRVLLDALQLGHAGDVNHLIKLAMLLRDPQAGIGAARHDVSICKTCTQGQHLAKRCGQGVMRVQRVALQG